MGIGKYEKDENWEERKRMEIGYSERSMGIRKRERRMGIGKTEREVMIGKSIRSLNRKVKKNRKNRFIDFFPLVRKCQRGEASRI